MTRHWLTYRPVTGAAEIKLAGELITRDLPHCSLEKYITKNSSVLGAFDQGELVACLHWRPVPATWLDQNIAIGQTGPGATAPSYRSNGVMRTLLRLALHEMKTAGVSLAGQETPVIGYHRTTGWEIATTARRHLASASSLAAIDPAPLVCRPCGEADIPAVQKLWESKARSRPLTPARTSAHWEHLTRSRRLLCAEGPEGLSGYMVLEATTKNAPPVIAETGTLTSEATKALLQFLAVDHDKPHIQIEWWTPADQVDLFTFPDPRAVQSSTEIDKLLRVVDAVTVIASLAKTAARGPAFDLIVTDTVADWNSVAIQVQPGSGAEVITEPARRPHVDVRAVAALSAGSATASDLVSAGLLPAGQAESFALLEPPYRRTSWYPEPL